MYKKTTGSDKLTEPLSRFEKKKSLSHNTKRFRIDLPLSLSGQFRDFLSLDWEPLSFNPPVHLFLRTCGNLYYTLI